MASTGSDGYSTRIIEVWLGDQFFGYGDWWEADFYQRAGYRVIQSNPTQGDQNDLER